MVRTEFQTHQLTVKNSQRKLKGAWFNLLMLPGKEREKNMAKILRVILLAK